MGRPDSKSSARAASRKPAIKADDLEVPELIGKNALTPREIIQAEANLLQFPFFALHTKGLRQRKGIEVTGTKRIDDQDHEFVYRITRNTDSMYPGPLSRKVHFALLSMLADPAKSSFPFENPIPFRWRELAEKAGIAWAGQGAISKMKDAICCTHGVVITSNHALIGRTPEGVKEPLPKRQRGYHLYEEYAFCNELGPDGDVATENRVWLADWYLSNLNSLYSGPLKYELWRRLNDKSPIASRIYEFLLFKCISIPVLKINYPKFCSFLPIVPHAFASRAKQQLDPVFRILVDAKVVSRYRWSESRDGQFQLHIYPGRQLRRDVGPEIEQISDDRLPDLMDDLHVRELSNDETDERAVVQQFHELWSGNGNRRPFKSESEAARSLIEIHGAEMVQAVMPRVVKAMKNQFPKAKTFGATRDYFNAEVARYEKEERLRAKQEQERLEQARQDKQRALRRQSRNERKDALLELWQELSADDQKRLRAEAIKATKYDMLRRVLRQKTNMAEPAPEFLDQLALENGLPTIREATDESAA